MSKKDSYLMTMSRDTIVALVDSGFRFTKKSVQHFDICKDYQAGLTTAAISKKYEIAEFSTIYKIIDKKCPECKRD